MVPARSHKVSRVSWYSGYCCPSKSSLTWLSHSLAGLPRTFLLDLSVTYAVLTPECTHSGLGSSALARHYLRNHCCFLFLRLLRCFSSPGSLCTPIQLPPVQCTVAEGFSAGFPHSDICGSKLHCQLPAAFRRLARLSSPVIAKASTRCTYSLDPQ